ncbi:hypothetical protein [Arthrobacter sp. zg-Y1110]|uniref:hypothetical protein n=1 Tax=Arthrobacter sp. zg-Y1110 TaxID=2886932 RepID=UPI001D138558|nr:hypothetical protein [Arthrobacter sp. zg-Y1110]MCC3292448.1 hypothetical protein [Arthrobacter sp. zg-Y1110]UWX87119.1 hypothetical protein N2K99_17545 [Arthrobacter sp. zg-Y1110]
MPDVSSRRRETGTGIAGRFASEEHAESAVILPANPVLAASTVEWARNLTGTYDADSTDGYYDAMGEIFDAARTVAEQGTAGNRELSAEKVEWARNLTGTYRADSTDGYYDAMGEIFDAASTVAVRSPEELRTVRLKDEAALLSRETGVSAEDIELFQDAAQYVTPGTDDWLAEMNIWADIMDCDRATTDTIDTRMRAAAG